MSASRQVSEVPSEPVECKAISLGSVVAFLGRTHSVFARSVWVWSYHPRFAGEDFRALQEVPVLLVLYFPGSRRNYRGMKGKY